MASSVLDKSISVNRNFNFDRCSPCLDDGIHTSARHYCLDCVMYFCGNCVKCHNKIPVSRSHQVNTCDIVDSTTADDDTTKQRGVSSTSSEMLKCMKHQDKYIDTFCKDHDKVCCATCAVVKHRSCTTELIAVSSKNYKSSQDVSDSKQRLTDVLTELKQETDKRTNNLESIRKQKLEHIETVDKYEAKLIEKVKEMAYNSRAEIRAKYEEGKSAIEDELVPLNVASNTVGEYLENLEDTDNKPLLFTNTKKRLSFAKDAEMLLKHEMDKRTEIETVFYLDTSLKTYRTSLGRLEVQPPVEEYKATFEKNIYTTVRGDKTTSIIDVCLMDSNDLIIADQGNTKIIRYNSDLVFKDELKLSRKPASVCNIGENKVAVRMRTSRIINIVSVDQSMILTATFTLSGDGNGMACDTDSGEIYVCDEKILSVYGKTGTKLRTYDKDANGEALFSDCVKVALSENKQNIYVADRYKGLVVLYKNGTLKMKVDVPGGDGDTFPLCLLPGNICLVGRDAASTMTQLGMDGKLLGNIIDSKDGRASTWSAVYDRENSRLIVVGYPSVMSIYTIAGK